MADDVLTEVRFWLMVTEESRRTICCPPELESTVRDALATVPWGSIHEVVASPVLAGQRQLLIIDSHAIEGAANEAMVEAWRFRP